MKPQWKIALIVCCLLPALCAFSQSSDTNHTFPVMQISMPVKKATLSATLFQPVSKSSIAVLLIAGSGPTDRDGNSVGIPGKNNSLLQVADSLARYGIASLRYDKRGIGKSTVDPGLSEKDMTIDDLADDAVALYQWLKNKGYQHVFVAGHSEGSLIALMIAGRVRPAGLISIAGAGRKASVILKEQLDAQLPEPLKTSCFNAFDSLEKGLTVQQVDPSLFALLRPSVQPYMRSWFAQDPQQLIKQVTSPVLLLQGLRDIQVSVTDVNCLHQADTAAQLVVIPLMNHLMKKIETDDRSENIKSYTNPQLPVMEELVKAMVIFIETTTKK